MAREPSQKLVDYGIIGTILFGAYVVWSFVFKTEKKVCPTGYHEANPCEGQIGLPKFLCDFGRNITGAALDCKPDVAVTCLPGFHFVNGVCEAIGAGGCNVMAETCTRQGENWFLNEKTCRCEPKSYHDECTLGDKQCPTTGLGLVEECMFMVYPDGSKAGNRWQIAQPETACEKGKPIKPVISACAKSECTPGAQICDPNAISRICVPLGAGCEDRGIWSQGGQACKIASHIVECSCGKVDLNNPPGTTCETACPIAAGIDCQASIKDFEVCAARKDEVVNWCTDLSGNPLVAMLKRGYEPAEEYTGPGQFDNPNMKRCAWKKSGKASESEFNEWAKSCRDAGNVASTYPTYPGYETLDSINRAYTAGEFPGAGTIFCLRKVN